MHEKLLWFNDNIQYMFHENIVEYDMVAASISVSEHFHLLDDATIQHLKLLPKEQRTRRIGCMQRDDKNFSEQLISGILEMRRKFIERNGLDERSVLALHSDAIMFASKKPIISDIDGVEFMHKHTWSSYIHYQNVEMFYGDGHIDYKGIPKDILNQHTLGIHTYLCKIFDMIENYDTSVLKYISRFQKQYLQDKLQEYFYIPFGKNGTYKFDNLGLFAFIANIVLSEVNSW